MARGLVGQDPGEVLAHQQAGDADVAAEEAVLDRHDPHVVAARARPSSGASTAGAVGAGEDADRRARAGAAATTWPGCGAHAAVRARDGAR